jgi:hypothetical protein
MLKDMKLSTILLLAVVAFLIYCLMKPSEGFANSESEAESKAESKAEVESGQEEADSEQEVEPEAEAEISAELVNQVLAESEGRMSVPKAAVPEGSVLDYQPNDEDVGAGASLDSAFDKPVPEGVKTDVVDLNRNNVKNYNAKDYLPKEVNDDWFNTDFSQAKYKMNDDKLINTERYVVGVNTVGQSLKNASYDIRGAINVPKYSVSPWNNSTTEPDYNIKPLC